MAQAIHGALQEAGLPTQRHTWRLPTPSHPALSQLDALMRAPLQAADWLQHLADTLSQAAMPLAQATDSSRPLLDTLIALPGCVDGLLPGCRPRCPQSPPALTSEATAWAANTVATLPHAGLRQTLGPLLQTLFILHGQQQAQWSAADRQRAAYALQGLGILPGSSGSAASPAAAIPALATLLAGTDANTQACAALALADATETAVRRLQTLQRDELPPLHWRRGTALGEVVLDTTGDAHHHRIGNTLLLIDTDGNDHYRFEASSRARPASVLIDLAGDDHYLSGADASGPAVAVQGLHLLWDSAGNDRYDSGGHRMAQAAAAFGVALLVDEAGDDLYLATSHAQAWALGGLAVLLDLSGNDRYHALSMAQASALPLGSALLFDGAGHDRYTLAAQPLLKPSAQLPERNLSMGQGAAMGLRASHAKAPELPGGLALLFDATGNDHYQAEVFAQGAGYFQGLGMLVDGGGANQLEAAWYAMGAAAHRGAGLLWTGGSGPNRYHASHSTSLGAAHDQSLAVFIGSAGDDRYAVADLGLGAASDNSVALFIEPGGNDRYTVTAPRCRALGAAVRDDSDPDRLGLPGLGLFWDQHGDDHYPGPPHPRRSRSTQTPCDGPANQRSWRWPAHAPGTSGVALSETGLGIDSHTAPAPQLPLR